MLSFIVDRSKRATRWSCWIAVSALVLFASPAAAEGDGRALAARDVKVERAGSVLTLRKGDPVLAGDVLRSGRSGTAQIEFEDGTRIALGPNSMLSIDNILMRRNGTARKFAVSSVGGTFRFLSGKSPHRAYSIRTPSATMSVRGTAFDVVASGKAATDLLVFNGKVVFCGTGGNCVQVPGGCNLLSVDKDSNISAPDKASRLGGTFEYARAGGPLLSSFRTSREGCERENSYRVPASAAQPASQSFDADSPPAPAPAPDPTPPDVDPPK